MCNKCMEIDRKISRLRDLAVLVSDQRTIDGIDELIAEQEVQKIELHPEKKGIGAAD
jgi:hypothetical protein